MNKRIAVLYNSKAGKGKAIRIAGWLQRKLSELPDSYTIYRDYWPSSFENFSDIWIVGGDGTLNYFVNHYPNCVLPILIFKGGTGNDFAWKLYGKKSLEECFEIGISASPKKVDAGVCNGKLFLNGVGIGFDGEIVKSIYREKFFFKGHTAYYAAVVRKVFFFRENELEINTKEISWKERVFMLTIANGSRYGGGFLVAPEAKIDDGLLDIILIPEISIMQRVNLLPGANKGKHLQIAKSVRSQYVSVKANTKVSAHFDGEVMEDETFEIELLPKKFLFRY